MAGSTFTAEVSSWVRDVQVVHEAVFRQSAQEVVEEMLTPRGAGGNMPVDTGFLRASLMASTANMPVMREDARPVEGQSYAPSSAVSLVIAGAELGETIYLGFTAAYARRVNYLPGYLFVEKAAQNWPAIVARVEVELVGRAGLN